LCELLDELLAFIYLSRPGRTSRSLVRESGFVQQSPTVQTRILAVERVTKALLEERRRVNSRLDRRVVHLSLSLVLLPVRESTRSAGTVLVSCRYDRRGFERFRGGAIHPAVDRSPRRTVAVGESPLCDAEVVRNRGQNPLDRAFVLDLVERVV
jgi:hypothetical protein